MTEIWQEIKPMLKTYLVDTEGLGLYGPPVLLQFSIGNGPIKLVNLWKEPILKIKALIEDVIANRIVAHNINHDMQCLQKFYNMMVWAEDNTDVEEMSQLSITQMVEAEYESRKGFCLKPTAAVDTMILSSKGDDQSSLMAAKPIYVRRVPKEYGQALADELTARTQLPWILFARKKQEPFAKWIVSERKDDNGKIDSRFVDVTLKFKPSNGLKDLHRYLFGSKGSNFKDIMPPEFPVGEGFCPYVAPLISKCDTEWNYTNLKGVVEGKLWPAMIKDHIEFWATNKPARKYAKNDIVMLRDLYQHFGSPDNDDDAVLACQIASVRLAGFPIDVETMREGRTKSVEFVNNAPINVNSPKQVKEYIAESLDPMEQLMLSKGCNAELLEKLVKEFTLDEEEDCDCDDPRFCKRCGGKGTVGPGPMECARRATLVEDVRKHKKRVELYDKLLLAGRAYPNFRAVGTKSGRLSGTDKLNFQGIDKSLLVRSMFTMCDAGEVLSGGDYDGQEVAIAGTTMSDDQLLDDMKKGKKIHGLFAAELFETTYEEIIRTNLDGTDPLRPTRYDRGKSAVFLTIYGGTSQTMAQRAGVSVEIAEKAFTNFVAKYPGVGHTKKLINDRFSAIHRNPEGGVEYRDPPIKYIESIFGFRRHFNTEFKLQQMIFDLTTELFRGEDASPFVDKVRNDNRKIVRDTKNHREQSMSGALGSALIGAAYSVGNGVIRAANNHLIQSAGRSITVGLQQAIWKLQPAGIHRFRVKPMSVHDEVACVSKAEYVDEVSQIVVNTIDQQCELVPLLQMTWGRHLTSWGAMKKVKETDEWDWVHAGIVL